MLLAGAGLCAFVSGFFTAAYTPATAGRPGTAFVAVTLCAWLLCIPLLVAFILWAGRALSIRGVAIVLATSGIISAVLNEPLAWKGSLGVYVTLLVLALVWDRSMLFTRGVLVVSAVLSAINDARYMALVAMLTVVATFVGPSVRQAFARHPIRWSLLAVGALLLLARGAILAMQSGLLGRAIALRTQNQFVGGRSWVEAARTEWAATLQLFSSHPWGFGIGEVTNGGLAREAITQVQSVGGDYSSSYFLVDVFGARVDLHSMTADLWYHFGIGGVLLVATIALLLLASLPLALSTIRTGGALLAFATLAGGWDLLFSPMGNLDRLIFAVSIGLLFTRRVRSKTDPAGSLPATEEVALRS
ncbi:hypothetical protein BIU90_13540 [Curtobacterium sp. MCBA15_001]|nr:hypothetical protein BIU90_13540 [Curtobacterium sp. MCBA15_001]